MEELRVDAKDAGRDAAGDEGSPANGGANPPPPNETCIVPFANLGETKLTKLAVAFVNIWHTL